MLKTKYRALVLSALLLSAGSAAFPPSVFARTAPQMMDSIKSAGLLKSGSQLRLWMFGDDAILYVTSDVNYTDDVLKRLGMELAAAVNSGAEKPTRLEFIFGAAGDNNLKTLIVNPESVPAAGSDAGAGKVEAAIVKGERASNRQATALSASQSPQPEGPSASVQKQYLADRARLVARINALESKGIGSKPFTDELSRADDLLRHNQLYPAAAIVGHLDSAIEAQEMQVNRPTAAVVTVSPMQHSALSNAPNELDQMAQLVQSGDYDESIALNILQHELGDLAPHKGPFRMERFRVAKALQVMRNSGTNISNLLILYRRVDGLAFAAVSDKRLLGQLTDQLSYLQQQCGLPALSGHTQHKDF